MQRFFKTWVCIVSLYPQLHCFLWQKLLVINQEICLGPAGVSTGPKQIPAAAGISALLSSEWIRCTASRRLQANAHFLFPVLKTHQESCRYVFYDGHCLNTEGKLGSQENRANVTTEFIDIYEFIVRKCLKLSSQLINEPVAVIVPPNTRTLSSLTLFIPPINTKENLDLYFNAVC